MNPTIIGIIRHVLTFGGGFLVQKGVVDSTNLEVGIGAIVTLVGIIWSCIHKNQVAKEIGNG